MNEFQQALTGAGTYATVMLVIFTEKYGTEAFTWDPQTIVMELEEDFNIELPPANLDRLLTAINLVTSDDFYQSLPDFVNFCNILSGDTYDPQSWDPADAAECAWGITECLLISPPENDNPFNEEIVGYISEVLRQEGIINPPDVLKIVKPTTSNPASEYSDDPIMFNSINDMETSKTAEINRVIKEHLRNLSGQLDALPLRAGDAKGAVNKMLQSLGNQHENDSLI